MNHCVRIKCAKDRQQSSGEAKTYSKETVPGFLIFYKALDDEISLLFLF